MVEERKREASRAAAAARAARSVSSRAVKAEVSGEASEAAPASSRDRSAMRAGKRPLQGNTRSRVIAISRSLGESMMRQPVTPTALQPKLIQRVRACFPQERQRWNRWSRL